MQKILKALITAVLLLVILGGGLATAEEYRLGPGDVLSISIWGLEDVVNPPMANGTSISSVSPVPRIDAAAVNGFVIRPDGKISFPLVGEVTAAGLTVGQFTGVITQALKEYINDPKVTVNIARLRTTRVYVLGEVFRPGMYELDKQHNLLDAVGIAGGYTQYAAKKSVFVLRSGKSDQPLKINLLKLLREGDMSQNVLLSEGDVVYLTSSGKMDFARDVLPFLTGAYYVGHADK
jgi:polysaccharide biosynthesis/export protein